MQRFLLQLFARSAIGLYGADLALFVDVLELWKQPFGELTMSCCCLPLSFQSDCLVVGFGLFAVGLVVDALLSLVRQSGVVEMRCSCLLVALWSRCLVVVFVVLVDACM